MQTHRSARLHVLSLIRHFSEGKTRKLVLNYLLRVTVVRGRNIRQRFNNSSGLAAAGVLLLLALTGVSSLAQKSTVTPRPIKNFGKVNDNYYRGSQPSQAQLAR
jgi:hypothetical protein